VSEDDASKADHYNATDGVIENLECDSK